MYGFLCCNRELNVAELEKNGWARCICGRLYQIWYNSLPKFENDHLFFESEKYIVLLDGVVFNISELMAEFHSPSWQDCFLSLCETDAIPGCLRGSFRGLIYDKFMEKITAFTNQTGEKTIYYHYETDIGLVIASHINIIKALFESNRMGKFEADFRSHYELLLTGSVLHGKTPFKGISRLTAGKLLRFCNGQLETSVYHRFTNVPEHEESLDECIEQADKLFRQAVDRIFRKSKEYGYKAECDLSGGLDSRLATWVAHDLGYKNVLNICYCVEGNLDHKISEQIAHDLGNEYFFLPMDAYVLGDVDRKALLNGGQVLYTISTGALYALEKIDTSNIGLCCTGLLGEISKADWVREEQHSKPSYITNRKSSYYQLNVPQYYCDEYMNYEQMNLYEYGFNLIYLSLLIRQEIVEAVSPLMDTDYLDYIFKIPLKYRKNYQFVERYICAKYPEAASYMWQTVRMPVDKHFRHEVYVSKIMGDVKILFVRCFNKALRLLNINRQFLRKDDMNPFEVWYRNNQEIRESMDDYFKGTIGFVSNDRLRLALSDMFHRSSLGKDKMQVINVLSIWKNYLK